MTRLLWRLVRFAPPVSRTATTTSAVKQSIFVNSVWQKSLIVVEIGCFISWANAVSVVSAVQCTVCSHWHTIIGTRLNDGRQIVPLAKHSITIISNSKFRMSLLISADSCLLDQRNMFSKHITIKWISMPPHCFATLKNKGGVFIHDLRCRKPKEGSAFPWWRFRTPGSRRSLHRVGSGFNS